MFVHSAHLQLLDTAADIWVPREVRQAFRRSSDASGHSGQDTGCRKRGTGSDREDAPTEGRLDCPNPDGAVAPMLGRLLEYLEPDARLDICFWSDESDSKKVKAGCDR